MLRDTEIGTQMLQSDFGYDIPVISNGMVDMERLSVALTQTSDSQHAAPIKASRLEGGMIVDAWGNPIFMVAYGGPPRSDGAVALPTLWTWSIGENGINEWGWGDDISVLRLDNGLHTFFGRKRCPSGSLSPERSWRWSLDLRP
jgi:hypothetical protein